MRTLKCISGEFGARMAGVLAVGLDPSVVTEARPLTASEVGRAIVVEPSQWAREIWRHSVGKNLESFFRANTHRPKQLIKFFKNKMPGVLEDVPEFPFMTRRQLEDYEQRRSNRAAVQMLHSGEGQSRTGDGVSTVHWLWRAFDAVSGSNERLFCGAPFKEDASPLYPERLDGTGRIGRSPPALVLWAYHDGRVGNMSPEQSIQNLALLARWHPAAAFRYAMYNLEREAPLKRRAPDLSVDFDSIWQVTRLWLPGGPVRNVDDMLGSMAYEVTMFLQSIKDQFVDPKRDLPVFYRSIQNLKHTLAGKHYGKLESRYREAYINCRDRMIATYFPDGTAATEPSAAQREGYPVGSRRKIIDADHYRQSLELRQWAWMEEVLVRTLFDKLVFLHATNTDQDRNAVALTLRGPEPFPLTLSQDQLRSSYDDALSDVVERVAIEQAHDYACRVCCAAISAVAYSRDAVLDAPAEDGMNVAAKC
ncbi:hypothetical protein GNI_120720 [Gregarina niphandrodes]|uniref:Uncharacterized protein n=1 Tax=Gregarina niphandrodes TaxID=110365 RepID=A0A023B2G4_GRENI|nr:hypothetical protein GNI_120720 [Gregarina niphandrodes]EZG54457.1 hypothetical protein GNI_120720 [Gregarina niphandrodes]|eukprot:XP_011131844.1 hypothetical protein GNI_120720 [Gregarina niphandrodes]